MLLRNFLVTLYHLSLNLENVKIYLLDQFPHLDNFKRPKNKTNKRTNRC